VVLIAAVFQERKKRKNLAVLKAFRTTPGDSLAFAPIFGVNRHSCPDFSSTVVDFYKFA
jgi:hypothetical protein